MSVYPPSDKPFARRHQAGWSVGEVAVLTGAGRKVWVVSGVNGENAIEVRGSGQAEAWQRDCEQAETVGMLRWPPGAACHRPGPAAENLLPVLRWSVTIAHHHSVTSCESPGAE